MQNDKQKSPSDIKKSVSKKMSNTDAKWKRYEVVVQFLMDGLGGDPNPITHGASKIIF